REVMLLCDSVSVFLFTLRTPPSSTLFPYTTLFRSHLRHLRIRRGHPGHRLPVEVALQVPGRGCRVLQQPHHHPRADEQPGPQGRSEEHTSELQSRENLVCRLLLEKKKQCYTMSMVR